MNHQEMNIIELIDENSEVISFEHIMTLDYAEREYIVLSPVDQESDSDEDEIVILRVEQDENGEDIWLGLTMEKNWIPLWRPMKNWPSSRIIKFG